MNEFFFLNSYSIFQILYSIFFFSIGTAIGSFLNVLIDRLPHNKRIDGRSHCDHCHKTLSPWDLIPLISFLLLRGRCRYCHKKLSGQYPLVEMLTGMIFLLIFNHQFSVNWKLENWNLIGNWLLIIISFAIASSLVVIFFADLKYQIIPDQIQIALFIFSVLYFISRIGVQLTLIALVWQLIAGVMVMIPILLIYLFTNGKGMGFGDVKLAFGIGVLLGVKGGLLALYFAFILGGIVGVYLLLTKKKKLKSKIAFGPFLVGGAIILLFFSQQIYSLLGI